MFGIAWCFISFALESGSPSAFTLFSFVIDLSITGCLFTALILQSTYLPHTLAGCSVADKWRVAGNETSLFAQIAIFENATAAAADMESKSTDVCKDFVTLWIICFVMM